MPISTALRTLVLAAALASCASTGIADSWVDPGLTAVPRFQRVFVAYLGSDSAAQHVAEDTMARHLPGTKVVRCYELFPDAPEVDPAAVRDQLRAAGCDAAVMMHLTRVAQELSYSPGVYPAFHSFGRCWSWAFAAPVDVRTDEIAHVVTNAYSLVDDKLLYSARSETFNPSSTGKMVEEIAAAIVNDLGDKGLLR